MRIKRLLMLSKEYPSENDPSYSFVEKLALGFSDAGVAVTVIAPLSLTRILRHKKKMPPRRVDGASLTVLRPLTLSFSDRCPPLNQWLFKRSAKNGLRSVSEKHDAVYGHFVSLSGMTAAELGAEKSIPSFLGYGESSPKLYRMYSPAALKKAFSSLTGVIAVSSENARELRAQHIVPEQTPFGVFPNGSDPARFHPMDREQARKELGFPKDAFIVCFVGSFIARKGIKVLSDALKTLPDVHSIFIGQGEIAPDAPNMLHVGPLPNDKIPQHLAASDVFVLPTLAEGCCNAIVEALSMGLPVVSSDLPFNLDILDETNALLVDPSNAGKVAQAIDAIRANPEIRQRLSLGALHKAQELTIAARVQGILRFMEDTGFDRKK